MPGSEEGMTDPSSNMNLLPWDPREELELLRSQVDRLWDAFCAKLSQAREGEELVSFLPELDLVETSHDFRLFIAVPGLLEDDIEIETHGSTLVVRGARQPPYDPQREHVREWRYGFFERSVSFPQPLQAEQIRAACDAGVLTVIVPKTVRPEGDNS